MRVVHEDCGHEVSVEIRCPECERAVAAQELRAKPRRGVTEAPAAGEPGCISGRLMSAGGVRLER